MSVPERIRSLLLERGLSWPAPIEHFPVLGSTSDRLKEQAEAGAPAWSVVIADVQTAGRGRQNHRWYSAPGDLFLSVLLRPSFGVRRAALIPMAAAVAVSEALAELGVTTALKWPNDVRVGDRKIAGILAEGVSSAGTLEALVLGLGVNLDLEPGTLPLELRDTVTSVRAEIGRAPEVVEAAARVLARLTVCYHALAHDGPAAVLVQWRARSVPWWGKTVEVVSGGRPIRGIATGVDERGALLLAVEDGSVQAVLSGEARELRAVPGQEAAGGKADTPKT